MKEVYTEKCITHAHDTYNLISENTLKRIVLPRVVSEGIKLYVKKNPKLDAQLLIFEMLTGEKSKN